MNWTTGVKNTCQDNKAVNISMCSLFIGLAGMEVTIPGHKIMRRSFVSIRESVGQFIRSDNSLTFSVQQSGHP